MSVEAPNYTQVPNELLDRHLASITSLSELKVTLAIVRQTVGFHRDERCMTLSQLQGVTGMSRPAVTDGVNAAIERGFVGRRRRGQGFIYGLRVKNLASKESLPEPVRLSNRSLHTERKGKKTSPKGSPLGFEEWLADHVERTGHTPPGPGTKGRAELERMFSLCLEEAGGDVEALKLATVGAHASEWRRERSLDKATNVLRVSKVLELANDGRAAIRSGAATNGAGVIRRDLDGVPQISRDAGKTWSTDLEAVATR